MIERDSVTGGRCQSQRTVAECSARGGGGWCGGIGMIDLNCEAILHWCAIPTTPLRNQLATFIYCRGFAANVQYSQNSSKIVL
jgi:hypothetical protein